MLDKFKDECGVFGVFGHPEAANLTYLGLYALQHRGQESAGIAASDGVGVHVEKAMGWVSDVFGPERLRRLHGRLAIGHVRYSTAGSSTLRVLPQALAQVTGAYSLLMLTPDALIGCRDPHGFRPLVLGRLGDAWLLASETCALDLLEAEFVRDVEPGEIVIIDRSGVRSIKPFPAVRPLQCVFEYIYFARPDSTLWGQNVYHARKALGHRLAEEH